MTSFSQLIAPKEEREEEREEEEGGTNMFDFVCLFELKSLVLFD